MSEVLKDFSANIDLKETLVFEPIKVVEGDNGNVLVLNIVKDGDPVDLTDCLVQIVFAHSGRTVWQDSSSPSGGITISGADNNIVTVRLHSDSYAPNGITVCQVKVYSGPTQTTLVSSSRFSFKAELSLLNAETVESIEQYSILVTMIETVNGMLDRDQADWDETDTLLVSYIRNKPVAGTDYQSATQVLAAETTLSDTDTVPFYDASATAHRKSTWANIVAKIRTALFGSVTGLLKLDGAGNGSAGVANTDYAAATHASRHLIGGADALNAMPYDATSTNLVINGGFDVWQRGTSFSSGYTADRWCIEFNGTGATRAITRQAFTVGQTDVPSNPTYYLRYVQSVGGSGGTYNFVTQRIEDVSRLSGKTVTLSFYAKADSSRNVETQVDQNFGDGGSSTVYADGVIHALTTSWQLFTRTLTLPSVSGKTIGVNNFCSVYIKFPLNTTFTIDIANVQLNYGSVALPFVPRSYADELRLCQRYYIPAVGALCCGYAAGTTMPVLIPTPVPMRVSPSVAATSWDNIIIGTSVVSITGYTGTSVRQNGVQVTLSLGASIATTTSGTAANTNLALDAEL